MNSANYDRENNNNKSSDIHKRSFNSLLIIIAVSLSTISIALLIASDYDYSYAQTDDAILDDDDGAANTADTATPDTTTSVANTPTIEITSHQDGDQVISAAELTIQGISSDNEETDCEVYADLRGIDPYQNTSAIGPGGEDDFSSWTFTYTEDYRLPAPGTNDITSKITCFDGPSELSEWNSINITGVTSIDNDASSQMEEGLGDTSFPVPMPSTSSPPSERGLSSSDDGDDESTTDDAGEDEGDAGEDESEANDESTTDDGDGDEVDIEV